MNKKKNLIIIFTLLISIILLFNYNKNRYYNNYFHNNKENLNLIRNYIQEKELEGYIYLKSIKNQDNQILEHKGSLGKCYKEGQCKKLIMLLEKSEISSINYFSHNSDKNFYGKKGKFLIIKTYNKIYGNYGNQIFYSEGYFKSKKEMDKIDNNRYNRIIKIFNNDWGIINFNFGDNFGAFG